MMVALSVVSHHGSRIRLCPFVRLTRLGLFIHGGNPLKATPRQAFQRPSLDYPRNLQIPIRPSSSRYLLENWFRFFKENASFFKGRPHTPKKAGYLESGVRHRSALAQLKLRPDAFRRSSQSSTELCHLARDAQRADWPLFSAREKGAKSGG